MLRTAVVNRKARLQTSRDHMFLLLFPVLFLRIIEISMKTQTAGTADRPFEMNVRSVRTCSANVSCWASTVIQKVLKLSEASIKTFFEFCHFHQHFLMWCFNTCKKKLKETRLLSFFLCICFNCNIYFVTFETQKWYFHLKFNLSKIKINVSPCSGLFICPHCGPHPAHLWAPHPFAKN